MSSYRLFTLLGPSFLRNRAPIPPKFDRVSCKPSTRFRCCASSALSFSSDASALATDDSSAVTVHPWPEWVKFIDRLKAKGYLTQNAAVSENGSEVSNGGASVYTDMKLVKDACLSFGRDRFDIFKSLSTQDIQTIVQQGCPNLRRKAVNSSKRLRAYLKLDEGDVCSACSLRESCDRANVMLNDAEAVARTVDVVRILIFYALDPLAFNGENKLPGGELVESSAKKLLTELIELGDMPRDPDLPIPASATLQRKKPSNLSDDKMSKNVDTKLDDWTCIKCNSINSSKSRQCHSCGYKAPIAHTYDGEMKRGDWICPGCNFMNFARNGYCLKCQTERVTNVDGADRKKGDWDCPQCYFMNFARNRHCFRCQEPRPQRELRPGDWECPKCDFVNFSRNSVCRKCNSDRPSPLLDDDDGEMWKKPY